MQKLNLLPPRVRHSALPAGVTLKRVSQLQWNPQLKAAFTVGLAKSLGISNVSRLTVGDPDDVTVADEGEEQSPPPAAGRRRSALQTPAMIQGLAVPFSVAVGAEAGAGARAAAMAAEIASVASNSSSQLHAALAFAGIVTPAMTIAATDTPKATVVCAVAVAVAPQSSTQSAMTELQQATATGGKVERDVAAAVGSAVIIASTAPDRKSVV